MSDQISEKMARKLAKHTPTLTEAAMVDRWRAAGLIKPSKLDEAREWVRKAAVYNHGESSWEIGHVDGVRDTAERFEAAITEILEERE